MRHIKIAFWGGLAMLTGLWLAADPHALQATGVLALRWPMVQLTGILAMGCMSMAMILALRPRWPERWLGGLDKMYRLHKWLGIGGLVLAVAHWLWAQGPKWAVALGWLDPPQRGARPPVEHALQQFFVTQRSLAEGVGEWAYFAAVLLTVAALVRWIPYSVFYKTHRLFAIAYLALVFHTVVLLQFSYWTTPVGILLATMLAYGTVAAILVLFRRVGAGRKVAGTITRLHYYPSLRVLEGEIALPHGWPGHQAGQFAFVSGAPGEEPHPFTIASAWNPGTPRLTFAAKELGDFTRTLRDTRRVGEAVVVEGPYGCFTFEDTCPRQIWVGGGVGIAPFIARMKQLAQQRHAEPATSSTQEIHLFHATADYSEEALAKLQTDADAAHVTLHVSYDARDGLLTGERIRTLVPGWHEASIWFSGPTGFAAALQTDFARQGMNLNKHFHQELFAMR